MVVLHFVPDQYPKLVKSIILITLAKLIKILANLINNLYFIGLG